MYNILYGPVKLLSFFQKQFNNLKLHKKIMLTFFVLFFLMIGLLVFCIFTFTASSIRRQNAFSLQQSFQQSYDYLTYKLSSIRSSSDILIYNTTLNNILNEDSGNISTNKQFSDSRTILSLLKNMQEDEDIIQARIYVPDLLSYSGNQINICSFSQAEAAPWYEHLQTRKGQQIFVGTTLLEDLPYPESACIALIRPMYHINNYSQLSFILRLDVTLSSLEAILASANYTNDSLTFLIDTTDEIIACSPVNQNASLIWKYGEIHELPEIPAEKVLTVSVDTVKMITYRKHVANTTWDMITLVPYDSFSMSITSLVQVFLLVTFLIIILSGILCRMFAESLTRRISRLCQYMQETKNGHLTKIPDTIYLDEIGTLYQSYNSMITQINTLINKNNEIAKNLKNAEYKALQAQINPHFLYNTLDMISWMSYQNKTTEISQVIYSLANFYRLSLAKGKDIIPLNNELNHIKYYMQIQEKRFSSTINFQILVNPDLLQYSIPKLTLQPLIENAISHGILETPNRSGNITVTGIQLGENFQITVTDDGIGIPLEKLECLLSDFSDTLESDSGNHYGLRNINKRIKLQYGDTYGLSFESILGKGTSVHVLLPAVYVDELS